jgi:protein TonB
MYYLETGQDTHTRFRNAVILALIAHAALILGISFNANSTRSNTPQIEVTLASRPSTEIPEDAQLIAQSNQVGSGDLSAVNKISSRENLPANSPLEHQALMQTPQDQVATQQDRVTTKRARERVADKQGEQEQQKTNLDGISTEVDRLNQELASLQAELDEKTRTYADQPRVRRLTAASAKQSVDAAYLLDWRRRLEAVGNQYYPRASVRYGIYGDLRLLVVIRDDGSLEDIRVLSSSGYAVLDEAAIKIVRMAAPYSPFPPELKATTDKLEIVRTWHFQENELSSP